VEYSAKANTAKIGHAKGRSHTKGGVQEKEVKKVHMVDIISM
jgi:hypothetical protein